MADDRSRVSSLLPGYEIDEAIGQGAFGIVWSGTHCQLGRAVAVKQLFPVLAANPGVRARFVAEARVVASLNHPHLVPVFDYVERDGTCLLVMERLTGGTVGERLHHQGIDAPEACATLLATAAGLAYAHDRGVLHRDVKPQNLMYDGSGLLKVTDFGIAKVVGGSESIVTRTGAVMGTPAYMAPEQAEGHDLGPQSDVYAAGVVLYELLSGRLPFSEQGGALAVLYRRVHEAPIPLAAVAPRVAPALVQVTMRALARSPADRYRSFGEFGAALTDAATATWGVDWLSAVDVQVMGGGFLSNREIGSGGATPYRAELPNRPPRMRPPHENSVENPRAPIQGSLDSGAVRELARVGSPRRPAQIAAALFVLALVVSLLGPGGSPRAGGLRRGEVTLSGQDLAVDGVTVDLAKPVAVTIDNTGRLASVTEVELVVSVAGVVLGRSSREPVETEVAGGIDGLSTASVAVRGVRLLTGGTFSASVRFFDRGRLQARQDFRARTKNLGVFSIPGLTTLVLAAVVIAYAESLLQPLRQGSRLATTTAGIALVGGGTGLVIVAVPWLLGLQEPTMLAIASVVILGALGGLSLSEAVLRRGVQRWNHDLLGPADPV